MLFSRNHFAAVVIPKSVVTLLLKHSLTLVFAFLFIKQQPSLFAANFDQRDQQAYRFISLPVLSSSAYDHTFVLHLPFNALPSTPGQKGANDNELEEDLNDDLDDDWNPLAANISVERLFRIDFVRNRFDQVPFSEQNGPMVPFFILYHSWKSFIS